MGFNYRLEFDQLNVTLPSANAENSVAINILHLVVLSFPLIWRIYFWKTALPYIRTTRVK